MTYEEAYKLRFAAESTNDPDAYEKAAAAFEALNMMSAAERCRDRAKFYRGQA